MSNTQQNPAAGLPHDIRGLLPYHTPWWHYALGGLLAVVLGALLLWGLWSLRVHLRSKARPLPPVDPWDTLESRIRVLLPPGDFSRGPAQENYFFNLSLLLREAIELRTGIRATDLTLYELRTPLRRKLPFALQETEAVIGFLDRADMVKFASAPSNREEALGDHHRVLQWIDQLRPRAVEGVSSLPNDRIFEAQHGRSAAQYGRDMRLGESAQEGSHPTSRGGDVP
jgi:hypothetical protein